MLELEARATRKRGSPSISFAETDRRDLLRKERNARHQEDAFGARPRTDEDVLERLALDHPLAKILLDYREISKLKSTYTDKCRRW